MWDEDDKVRQNRNAKGNGGFGCALLAVGIGRECPGADDERVADETDRFG